MEEKELSCSSEGGETNFVSDGYASSADTKPDMQAFSLQIGNNREEDPLAKYFQEAGYLSYFESLNSRGVSPVLNLSSPPGFEDLPRSARAKLGKTNSVDETRVLELLKKEADVMGMPAYKLRRILNVYPVPMKGISGNDLSFPSDIDAGEQPIIVDLKSGDKVAMMVSVPYPSKGLSTRYTAEPNMGLLAMRHLDLYNHLAKLTELGILKEEDVSQEILENRQMNYGVYAPDYDDEKWIERLKEAIIQIKKKGAEVSVLAVSMVSQSAAGNQARLISEIGKRFPEILIIEGGNLGFNLGSYNKSRPDAGHGMFVGKGEQLIYEACKAMDALYEQGRKSPSERPYEAMSLLRKKLEQGEIAGIEAAKMRTSLESDTDTFSAKTGAENKALPPLALPKRVYGPYTFRFDGNFDEAGNPIRTMWVYEDEACIFNCSFCGYPQGQEDNTEFHLLMYYFEQFANLGKNTERIAHWNEVPTFTAQPPREYLSYLSTVFGESEATQKAFEVNSFLRNYPKFKQLVADGKLNVKGGYLRNDQRFENYMNFRSYLKEIKLKYGDRFRWQMMTRIDEVIANDNKNVEGGIGEEEIQLGREQMMRMLEDGLDYVSASPESMNKQVLDLFFKRFTPEHYSQYIDMLVSIADDEIPGTDGVKVKDRLRIGSSFIMTVPDIKRISTLKDEGKSPFEIKNLIRNEWFESRKMALLEQGHDEETVNDLLVGEPVGMMDSLSDVKFLMKEFKKLIAAGYNLSFAANHLTPLAPAKSYTWKPDQETDLKKGSWWSAYLFLSGKTQASFAKDPVMPGHEHAGKFESRFDPDFGKIFMDPQELLAYHNALVDIFTDTFGHKDAVARKGDVVYLRTGEVINLKKRRTPEDDIKGVAYAIIEELFTKYGNAEIVREYLEQQISTGGDVEVIRSIHKEAIKLLTEGPLHKGDTPSSGVPAFTPQKKTPIPPTKTSASLQSSKDSVNPDEMIGYVYVPTEKIE